jgi:hypothetical protein
MLLQVLKRNCSNPSVTFEILSNPEFLAEGTAMEGEVMHLQQHLHALYCSPGVTYLCLAHNQSHISLSSHTS